MFHRICIDQKEVIEPLYPSVRIAVGFLNSATERSGETMLAMRRGLP